MSLLNETFFLDVLADAAAAAAAAADVDDECWPRSIISIVDSLLPLPLTLITLSNSLGFVSIRFSMSTSGVCRGRDNDEYSLSVLPPISNF